MRIEAGAAAWTFHTRQGFNLTTTCLRARIQANPVERALLEGDAAAGVVSLADMTAAAAWPLDVMLTIDLAGTGSGTVTSTPTGVTCTGSGTSCSASFTSGTSVTFTAAPDQNRVFAGWGGACSGLTTCTVTADVARLVVATFTPTPVLHISTYHLDALGSVRAVTDETGAVPESARNGAQQTTSQVDMAMWPWLY